MNTRVRTLVAICAIGPLCFPVVQPLPAAQEAGAPQLHLFITEGQGAIHNMRQRTGRSMAVRLEDENRQPLAGVSVVFTLPSDGAGGTFANGERTLVVTTGNDGVASASGVKPNKISGKFDVRVNASYQGRRATGTITQFNMAVENGKSSGGSGKWIAVLLAAGGAGAAGAVFAARGTSSAARPVSPPTPVTISISPGAGAVGPPQ